MATIYQALHVLKKAGLNISTINYRNTKCFTIEIPYGTPGNKEIEGTGKMIDTHYNDACSYALNTIYGFSSQAERVTEVMDEKAKNLKDFENQFFGTYKIPEVREIRYNGPATIVFWEDNTKTVVKVQPGEEYYDPDKAFAMAVCKKLFGNKFNRHLTKAQKAFEKSCEKEYEESIKNPLKVISSTVNDFNNFWRKINVYVDTKPKKEE